MTYPQSPTTTANRSALLWMVPLLLVVTWLGARSIDADAMWFDELWTMTVSGVGYFGPRTPPGVYAFMAAEDPWHPPGFYMTYNVWGWLMGGTAPAGRLLATMYGLLTLAAVYRLGRDLFDEWRVGVGAAVTLGFSAFFVYYMHELRNYTLMTLVTTIALWLYWRVSRRPFGVGYGIAFVAAFAGLFYTHYFAALGGVVIGVYHLLFARKNRRWWVLLGLMAIAAVLCIPWVRILLAGADMAEEDTLRASMALAQYEVLPKLLFSFSNGNTALWLLVAGGSIPLLWAQPAARFLWFYTAGLAGLVLVANGQLQLLSGLRYLMPFFPVLALLFGVGIWALTRRFAAGRWLPVIWGVWTVVGVWSVFNYSPLLVQYNSPYSDNLRDFAKAEPTMFHTLPWLDLRETLQTQAQPGDAVVLHRDVHTWSVAGLLDFYTADFPVEARLTFQMPGLVRTGGFQRSAREFLAPHDRLWYGDDHSQPPNQRLRAFETILAEDFLDCGRVIEHPNMDVHLYARTLADDDSRQVTSFEDGPRAYLLSGFPAETTDSLDIVLGWDVPADFTAAQYSFGVHLLDESGGLVTQYDAGLPDGVACVPVSVSLEGVPSGMYTAQIVVYEWETGERLQPDGVASLGVVRVE